MAETNSLSVMKSEFEKLNPDLDFNKLLQKTKKLSELEPNLLQHFLKNKDIHLLRKNASGIFKLKNI